MYNARIYRGIVDVNGYSDESIGHAINALYNRYTNCKSTIKPDDVIIVYKDNEEIMRGNANVLHKLCDVFENNNQMV